MKNLVLFIKKKLYSLKITTSDCYYKYISVERSEDSVILKTKYIINPHLFDFLFCGLLGKTTRVREFDVVFVKLNDVWVEAGLLIVCSDEMSEMLDKMTECAKVNPFGNYIGFI